MGVDPGQQRSRPDGGWQPHRGRGAALLLPLSNLFSWTASGGVSDHLPGTRSMLSRFARSVKPTVAIARRSLALRSSRPTLADGSMTPPGPPERPGNTTHTGCTPWRRGSWARPSNGPEVPRRIRIAPVDAKPLVAGEQPP